ncbi:adrenocorticotropic hormone receptor-like [Hydractinia symbiolongicarpus]|uniref:adrenocorticotropic hormone receptor-like n=1 Tax=Hydractinia symbiolongicarpus TaxID=13093 RepID=UPI00254C71CA|nr:adrenocorticotropic hormone receptor-like [Hydractinia symbiolongicarpus]
MSDNTTTPIICDLFGVELETNIYFHTTLAVLAIILAILTIIFNAIFLLVMFRFIQRLSVPDMLYAMLAVSDILTGILVMPSFSAFWIHALLSHSDCMLVNFVNVSVHILGVVSVSVIALITMDVFVSIVYPFLYPLYFTKRFVYIMFGLIWTLAIICPLALVIISIKDWYVYQNISGGIVIAVVLALFVMHLKLHHVLNNMRCQITHGNNEQKENLRAKRKASKLATSILVTLLISFAPSLVYFLLTAIEGNTVFTSSYFFQATGVWFFLNPLLDPFVYYFRLKRVRKNILKMFGSRIIPANMSTFTESTFNVRYPANYKSTNK